MPSEVVVEALSVQDISRNVALSSAVGWPDTESEWRVIYQAALVLGVKRDGELIGQGALGLFEGSASIAKMVVAPSAQRRGIGARILDALLLEAERRSLSRVGLVATPFGRPLYESRGFTPGDDVVICVGTPSFEAEPSGSWPIEDAEQLLAIERRFTGSARTAMLRGRLREACASAICAGGCALATPQPVGARIGPIFADSEETARALARDLFLRLGGPVRLDVPGEQRAFRGWLQLLGLVEKSVHLEMSRGGVPPWHVPQRYGQATQAWG
ncbi:MAG: GNAT family N-acetyltransferase [Pseudomonadota bacterium]